MKIVYSDHTEMDIVTCNENYRIADELGCKAHRTLVVGMKTNEALSTISEGLTAERLTEISIVNQAGATTYTDVKVEALGRSILEQETVCYLTFELV